ncbi:hypothetical protein ARMSODRAFT_1065937 [Armillaria solidipes]|uniref:Uncharacterized protein n=1 Tax=Armillaria solidipes TaxID=1076256 RepID=A0A2H3BCS8_9AGAR|nr:hypothetical protein ARMSODRAFT_1065937 [Armillaria solidipes]
MTAILILLYVVTTIDFIINWLHISSTFVHNNQSFRTIYTFCTIDRISFVIVTATSSVICIILSDSIIIWRCWIIWGQRWLTILLPVLFLFASIVCLKPSVAFKVIATYKEYINSDPTHLILGFLLYPSFVLAMTLWCTLLIVYRIISVAWTGNGLRAYRHAIEILVESSALYSIILIFYVALYAYGSSLLIYFDLVAVIARGVAPTLLVGRVAAGHARPDDSWHGSVISGSLHFGTHSRSQNSQQDSMMSSDLEAQVAQQDINDKSGHFSMVDSQEDPANKGPVHEDSPEALGERVEDDGGGNSENVVHGDDFEDQLNGPEDPLTEPAVLVVQRD